MSHDVLVGHDGWLFLKGGSNNPLDHPEQRRFFDTGMVTRWCDLLSSRIDSLRGVQYLHLFAPNKETIYFRQAGLTEEAISRSPLAKLYTTSTPQQKSLLSTAAVNPTAYFRKIASQYPLYWKTDSHWSPTGCFAAYQLLCSRLGVPPVNDLLSRPFGSGDVVMDLGSKLFPPAKERVRFYEFSNNANRIHANAIVRLKEQRHLENDVGLHVGSNVIFRNLAAPDPRRVILFGDSFSEYRTGLLTGMLAETFREIHFVWSVCLDFDYISRHDPDIVLSDIVERFMPTVPHNSFDLDRYVENKVSQFKD